MTISRINYNIMLCFEWKIGKFENVRIFKHYDHVLIKASKKKRNHCDLKEIEREKSFAANFV